MDQLGNIESAHGKLATHIVIQIVYGLEIIVQFNQPLGVGENLDETQKLLENTVNSIALKEEDMERFIS